MVSVQGSRAGGLSVEQGPAVTGASGPPASCTHVTFCVARSAAQADEQASDASHLRTAQDSHQAPPLPSGHRGTPAPGGGGGEAAPP